MSVFVSDTDLQFSLIVVSLADFGIRVIVLVTS